jgi:hypothetical protein
LDAQMTPAAGTTETLNEFAQTHNLFFVYRERQYQGKLIAKPFCELLPFPVDGSKARMLNSPVFEGGKDLRVYKHCGRFPIVDAPNEYRADDYREFWVDERYYDPANDYAVNLRYFMNRLVNS